VGFQPGAVDKQVGLRVVGHGGPLSQMRLSGEFILDARREILTPTPPSRASGQVSRFWRGEFKACCAVRSTEWHVGTSPTTLQVVREVFPGTMGEGTGADGKASAV
jgi:hypothetical protein